MMVGVETLANILEMIEQYEDNILNNIGLFIKRATGIDVYLIGKPFIKPQGAYIGLRIVSSGDSGGWSSIEKFEDEMISYSMDNNYTIEVMAFKGRPVTLLTYLLSAFRGFDEMKYQYLYSKGIGFLSATNISEANTVLDGDKTEQRARLMLTFNTRMVSQDLPTTEITDISMSINNIPSQGSEPVIYQIAGTYRIRAYTKAANDQYSFLNIDGLPKDTSATWTNNWINTTGA